MKNLPKGFDINHWRCIYNKIHEMGRHLKKCKDYQIVMKEGEEEFIESEIKTLMVNLSLYMDKYEIKMPTPKWIFNHRDTRTWPSSKDFIYQDHCK
jgi:hypothetical protein